MTFEPLAEGPLGKILFWAANKQDAKAAEENCPLITEAEKNKLPRLYRNFTETGEMPKSNEKFKKIEKQESLFAFKSFQIRLLGTFLDKVTFGICHCVRKKKQKYSDADLERAQINKNAMIKEWEREHP